MNRQNGILVAWAFSGGMCILVGLLQPIWASGALRLEYTIEEDRIDFQWPELWGHYYFLEHSATLPGRFSPIRLSRGEGEPERIRVSRSSTGPSAFYRLFVTRDRSDRRLRADDDGDQIINLFEVDEGMDAFVAEEWIDEDNDDLPDYWEQFYFRSLSWEWDDVMVDGGLSLGESYLAALDPRSLDSDGDGWRDGEELGWGWDPNYDQSRDDWRYAAEGDFDGDGTSNLTERFNGAALDDPEDSGPVAPGFAVIHVGEAGRFEVVDVANGGWVLLWDGEERRYLRWHWGQTETLMFEGEADDAFWCGKINSSGTVVGQVQYGDSRYWYTADGLVWHVVDRWAELVQPLAPDGHQQGVFAITDQGHIAGIAHVRFDGHLWRYIGMAGTVSEGLTDQLGTFTHSGFHRYAIQNGYVHDPFAYNSSGSFLSESIHYVDGEAMRNQQFAVINGAAPRRYRSLYDLNEANQLLAKSLAEPYPGVLVLSDGEEIDLGLSDDESLYELSSPQDAQEPLQILTSQRLMVQRRELDATGSMVLAPLDNADAFDSFALVDLIRDPSLRAHLSDFRTRGISADGTMISLEAYDASQERYISMLLVRVDLVPDYDRDGVIDNVDRNKVADSNPFRFWINDDDDSGEVDNDDVPGQTGIAADASGGFSGTVDGMRDLVDYFPLFFDVEDFVSHFDDLSTVDLKLSGQGMTYMLYDETFAGLAPEDAGDYLRELTVSRSLKNNDTRRVSSDPNTPSSLGAPFVQLASQGKGVLFLESHAATTDPLVVHVFVNGAELFKYEFPLSITGVEEMFEHRDLTGLAKEYDGTTAINPKSPAAPRTTAPNWPDELTNGKTFAFVHGYNVSGQAARGWQSEVFKRMHQMGSNARFVGITWNGDTGLDYHKAVFQAFHTGDAFNLSLNGEVTIAAHSLGNVVVGQAIQSGRFIPARYYMLNAATPNEAYGTGGSSTYMVEKDWVNIQDKSLYASNWYREFNTADDRSALSWKEAFMLVPDRTEVHNFYSKGEDVLDTLGDDNDASVLGQVLTGNFNFVRGAWKSQELVKGKTGFGSLASLALSRGQGGWRLNSSYQIGDDIKEKPRFSPFREANLHSSDTQLASNTATENVRFDLLARGIPALSDAAAVNTVPGVINFDMEASGRDPNEWPSEDHGGESSWDWLHSDFRNVALPYVYPMYQQMINEGALNEN